jgi:hypothetical protein
VSDYDDDRDELDYSPPVKPYSALTPFEKLCHRRDAFDKALETVQKRREDPEKLHPLYVAAGFGAHHWPAIVRWLLTERSTKCP